MTIFLRLIHPLFSWLVLVTYGWESIEKENFLLMVGMLLGLAGLSQTYWRLRLEDSKPYAKLDLVSFGFGLLPAIVFPILLVWHFWTNG
jgi:hypothetical protein